MASGKWFLCAALVMASGSMLIAADEPAPATQPSEVKPAARVKKLTEPWNLLKTLTPEQTAQIEKIHADAAEEIKKITSKETADITAVLTPDQITELKTAEARHKLEAKEKAAARKKETATTEPAK